MNNIAGEGILGLRNIIGPSIGYSLLFTENEEIEEIVDETENISRQPEHFLMKTITFYYGNFENYLILHTSESEK